jgi:uncharacterized membrane protein
MTTATTAIGQRVAQGRVTPGGAARHRTNVADTERLISVLGGGAMMIGGLARGSLGGLALAALGGCLVHRGLTGHCQLYAALGTGTTPDAGRGLVSSVPAGEGCKVVEAVTINRPAAELYRWWSNFENLPTVMHHLESVQVQGERSHWVAKGPMGKRVEWDAEIVNDKPDELIAWRSLEGADVASAGSVQFRQAPGGRGTEVIVTMKYDPPAGKLGSAVAWLFGEEPSVQVRDELHRLQQLMETGEIATTRGQPGGRPGEAAR